MFHSWRRPLEDIGYLCSRGLSAGGLESSRRKLREDLQSRFAAPATKLQCGKGLKSVAEPHARASSLYHSSSLLIGEPVFHLRARRKHLQLLQRLEVPDETKVRLHHRLQQVKAYPPLRPSSHVFSHLNNKSQIVHGNVAQMESTRRVPLLHRPMFRRGESMKDRPTSCGCRLPAMPRLNNAGAVL